MVYFPYVIDPRPASREKELEFLRAKNVLGIEVTIHELAAACSLGNIDPQHTDGNVNLCAAEAALDFPLPPDGATLATVRLDLDSAAAMAILNIRAAGTFAEIDRGRVARIAAFDKFSNSGAWSPLVEGTIDWSMRVLNQQVLDFKRPVEDRIEVVEQFLVGASVDDAAIAAAKAEWEDDKRLSEVDVVLDGAIAFVKSERRNATAVGYAHAPVVVALNPRFKHAANPEPHAKYTICQYAAGYVDLQAVARELNEIESGWGGSPTIIGSPQGVASTLKPETVAAIVANHLQR